MTRDVFGIRRLVGQSARALIILACVAPAHSGSLQDAVLNRGCSQYQDPKTIAPLRKFVEPAMDKGCVACHLDCNTLTPAQQKEPPAHYLKAKEPEVCMSCHASLGKDLSLSHDKQPLDQSRCTACHDPHSSDIPKLLLQYSHGPYAARLCSACHPAPSGAGVRLTAANVDSLCYGCHSNFKAAMAGAGSRHALLSRSDRSCMECHDPHAANQEYHLKKPAQDLCIGCHDAPPSQAVAKDAPRTASDNPEAQYLKLSSKYVHAPAKRSCLLCHDAHASQYAKELRVPVRDICMDCHGPNSERIAQGSQPFPLFNGLVSLPPKTFGNLKLFELSGKYVHEPVNVSCAFCHNPHASDYVAELYAPVTDLCLACHSTDGIRMIRSKDPFPLFGGKVNIPPKSFDQITVLNLKSRRLGHPTTDHPVWVAATKEKPELNCITCHESHSASTGPKLLVNDKKATCEKCHEM